MIIILKFFKFYNISKLKGNLELFPNKKNALSELLKFNKTDIIYKKISLIIQLKEKIKYNVNINMLLDKFIIEFSGVDKNEYN